MEVLLVLVILVVLASMAVNIFCGTQEKADKNAAATQVGFYKPGHRPLPARHEEVPRQSARPDHQTERRRSGQSLGRSVHGQDRQGSVGSTNTSSCRPASTTPIRSTSGPPGPTARTAPPTTSATGKALSTFVSCVTRQSRPPRRRGLTLVEVCLVLALLVVIASFAIPLLGGAVERAIAHERRRAAASGLDRARLAAMQSGQTYVVRFEPNGSRFQVLSLNQLALPESQELPPDDPDVEHSPYDILRFFKNRLPDGVIFGRADVANSNQLTATMGSAGDGPGPRRSCFVPTAPRPTPPSCWSMSRAKQSA